MALRKNKKVEPKTTDKEKEVKENKTIEAEKITLQADFLK